GLVTRRPLNCDHATPDVGHDAASGGLFHLGAHHLNLVTDFEHESLLTPLVGPIRRPAVVDCGTSMEFRCKVLVRARASNLRGCPAILGRTFVTSVLVAASASPLIDAGRSRPRSARRKQRSPEKASS